jgi:hypothetical protein
MPDVSSTPGPWIAKMQRSKEGRALGWIIETPRGDRIGWSSYADVETNEGDLPQSEPNAHLIAAAPELLAALISLKDHAAAEAMFVKGSDGAAWQPVEEPLAGLLAAAEVAISRAEGRES